MNSVLFCLDQSNCGLADRIIERANSWSVENKTSLGVLNYQEFADGERCIDFKTSVRGKRVYLLSPAHNSDTIIELLLAIDAAKRGAAREIIPLLPYFPYARQDKKDQDRGPIGGKVMALAIESIGATSVITLDLHADQIQGFFEIPVTHAEGKNVFLKTVHSILETLSHDDVVFCGPDAGSGKRLKRVKDQIEEAYDLYFPSVMLDKTRKKANEVDKMILIGDVTGKDVILVDDILDTGGTLCKGVELLYEKGAKSVRAIITHPVMSGPAYQRIFDSKLVELIVSDSLPIKDHFYKTIAGSDTGQFTNTNEKIRVVGIAQQFGLAIAATNNDLSFQELKANERNQKGS